MKNRCLSPGDTNYGNYGGRGIKVCERWLNFESFHADVGDGKKGWSIERIENGKGYELSNICWATPIRQARNKRNNRIITVSGITGCLAELCERFGCNYHLVYMRLWNGWTNEQAFFGLPNHLDLK